MSTHYEILGVEPDATPEQLRAAYLASARRHHPDRVGSGDATAASAAESRMQEVNLAWSVLRDPDERAAYDRSLQRPAAGDVGRSNAKPPAGAAEPKRSFTPYFESDEDDDDDWRYEPDPQDPSRTPPRVIVALPPALAVLGVAFMVLSIPIGIRALLAAGVVCLALSALAFVGAPLFAMIQGQQAEQRVEQERRRRR